MGASTRSRSTGTWATSRFRLLATLVAVALVAVACSTGNGETETPDGEVDNEAGETEAGDESASDEEPAEGGDSGEDVLLDQALQALERQELPDFAQPGDISEVQTKGNVGEDPAWYDEVELTEDQVREIRQSEYRAAFLNWDDAAYNQSVLAGARDALAALNIELVAVTNYEFDVSKLQSDVANVMPLDPDIIFYSGVNPTADAAALQPAVDAGVKIVSYANAPEGWTTGNPESFVSLVSYPTYQMGSKVADVVCDRYPDGARLGQLFFDATYKLVNEREEGFTNRINECESVEVVTEEPMADPFATQEIATAMVSRDADLDVIFAPWDLPAEGVVAGLRSANLTEDIDVATIDLGFFGARQIACEETVFVESSQLVYEWGRTGAMAAALSLLGEEVPPYLLVPVYAVTRDNLQEGWDLGFGGVVDLPQEARECLESG